MKVRDRCCAALFLAVLIPATGMAQTGNYSIRGTITSGGQPVPGAMVVHRGIIRSDTTRADSLGRYVMRSLPRGHQVFTVMKRGFAPIEMEVSFADDTALTADVPLERAQGTASLTPGGGGDLDSVGFNRRRQAAEASRDRRMTFLGPSEIAAKNAEQTNQLFLGVTDLTLRRDQGLWVAYGYDGRCVMNVWVDGSQVQNAFPPAVGRARRTSSTAEHYIGLDDLLQVNQIQAIEIYPRPTGVPSQFQPRVNQTANTGYDYETRTTDCGAIVIWGKH